MRFLLLLLAAFSLNAANLVPNSSFECGPGRGWTYWDFNERAGNTRSLVGSLTNSAWHGSNSLVVHSRLLSRPFWLVAGTYTMSLYARSTSGTAVYYNIMDSSALSAVPSVNSATTNGWQRYTTTFTATSNYFYYAKVAILVGLIDAIQVETGTVATAYSPSCSVEMGLDTAADYNLLMLGDAKQFRLRFWNESTATTAIGQYMIFDMWNRVVASNTFSTVLNANTNTTQVVALPQTNGWLRVVSRLNDCNDSWDETTISVLPFAAGSGRNINGFLGTHPNYNLVHMQRERRFGFTFGRDLSPAAPIRWTAIEPTSNNFVWPDAVVAALSTNDLVPYFNLATSLDGLWNPWATNSDGSANWSAYTNWAFKTVQRYSVAPYNVHYWETLNEPMNFNDAQPNNIFTNVAVFAQLTDMMVAAIRAADPNAYIIAMGGLNSALYEAYPVWTNLLEVTKTNIQAVSGHMYSDQDDPNVAWTDTHFSSPREWGNLFGGVKEMWNSESGAYSAGGYKTLNGLLQGKYDFSASFPVEAARFEREIRHQAAVDRSLYISLRCLGWGMRYMKYWSKEFNDSMFLGSATDPTTLEYNLTEFPNGVAMLMTLKFAGLSTSGRITNLNSIPMDLYLFTNTLGVSVSAWNGDRSMTTLTVTNSGFALFDCMGNVMQTNSLTVPINRTPRYLVSGTMTIHELSNTVRYATSAAAADVTPPNVSFDIAPSGSWDGSSPLKLVKWSGHDENKLVWLSNTVSAVTSPTNIVYKWKVDSGTYTDYSPSNHVWLPSISNGDHTFYVTAIDSLGNAAEYGYKFVATNYVAPPPNRNINIGTANVGRIISP